MRFRFFVLIILLVLAVISVRSCRKAASWLIEEELPVRADAIVFLMGSFADRVLETADLFEQGLADSVLIVEPGSGADKALEERGLTLLSESTRVCDALVALGIPADRLVVLPGDATSTQMEAMIVREYVLNKSSWDSLILVSSPFHTKRASKIFRYAFRKASSPVSIYCSPSSYTELEVEKWWKNREMVQRVIMEYLKMANFVFFERSSLRQQDPQGMPLKKIN